MDTKNFLEDYEITGWQISPKTYKFLGIAATINIFAIIILGQFNLLQTKACDSPYVGKVCQVLDYVSLGSTIAESGTGFTDKDYTPTTFEEADVTYIDVSGQEPPFTYPEGYFAAANQENQDLASLPPTDFGNFPTNGITTMPLPSEGGLPPQVLPTPNDKAASQNIPDSPFGFDEPTKSNPVKTPRVPNYNPHPTKRPPLKNNSPSKLPTLPGDQTVANSNSANSNTSANTVAKTSANANSASSTNDNKDDKKDLFNQKPLKDFGDKWGEAILKKDVDINAPFTIEIIGRLDENGKIINAQVKSSPDSDPKMTEVAKEAISAFSDSELLRTLYNVGGRDVKITFSQDKDNLQAIIKTQAKTEDDAKKIYSGVNAAMALVKIVKKGSDEANLMEKTQLDAAGKIFTINFLISNEDKTQLIEKSLKSLAEQKKQGNNGETNNQAISAK